MPITYFKIPDEAGPMPTSSLADCLKPQTRFGATAKSSASITTTRTSTNGMDSKLYARMSGTEISFEEDESDHSLLNIKIKGTLDKVKLAMQLVQDHIAPPNSHARCVPLTFKINLLPNIFSEIIFLHHWPKSLVNRGLIGHTHI